VRPMRPRLPDGAAHQAPFFFIATNLTCTGPRELWAEAWKPRRLEPVSTLVDRVAGAYVQAIRLKALAPV